MGEEDVLQQREEGNGELNEHFKDNAHLLKLSETINIYDKNEDKMRAACILQEKCCSGHVNEEANSGLILQDNIITECKRDSSNEILAITENVTTPQLISSKLQEVPGIKPELSKIKDVRVKMVPVLGNIKLSLINNIYDFLSLEEDLERIKQRTVEFEARFKRNYYFRSRCQVQELRDIGHNPLKIKSKSKLVLLLKKLTAAHYSVLQALQVIEKQLHSISVTQFMQDLLQGFFRFLYELSFMLKPFLGYTKSQPLDDVENLVVETINTIRAMRYEEANAVNLKEKKTTTPKINKTNKNKNKFSWRRSLPYAVRIAQFRQQIKDEDQKNQVEENKDFFFMMLMKERPGAKFRRFRCKQEQEPKTMVELLDQCSTLEKNEVDTSFYLRGTNCFENVQKLEDGNVIDDPEFAIRQSENINNEELLVLNLKPVSWDFDMKDLSRTFENLIMFRQDYNKLKKNKSTCSKKYLQAIEKITTRLLEESLQEFVKKTVEKLNEKDLSKLTNILKNK